MAKHIAGSVNYYLVINKDHLEDLAHIRHWSNLKVGSVDASFWVKDIDYAQAHSTEVKSIPFKTIYYEENGKLFLPGNLLPERSVPSVLWTSIDRAIPVKLPSLNHNFFGVEEKISIRLVGSDNETQAAAMVTSLSALQYYVPTAPAVRLQNLRWCVIHENQALIIGKPLLSLPGNTYWQVNDFLIPAGFGFEFPILTDVLHKKINPARDHWIIWNTDGSYSRLKKTNLVSLSRSSFQLTLDNRNTFTT